MPSRLMLRPVTKPLAGRALGKAFGEDRTLSEGSTSEGPPAQVSTEGPAQRAGIDRAAAQTPTEAMELRVIPLTSRTVREEPATEGAEGALRGPAEASAVEAPLNPALENGAPPASWQDVPATTGPLPVPASEATPTADASIDEDVATDHPTVAESPAEELEADEVEREPDPEPASSALDPSNDEREVPDREPEASLPQEEYDSVRSQTDLDDPEATSGDAPDAPEAPVDAAEGATPEQPVGPVDDTSADPDQLEEVRTGYSSLAYLKDLPVDAIKIDRSFVMGMENEPRNAAIVRSTVDLGRNLGLEVVAEGVETQAAYDELARLGCDYAQGFLLARPLPAPELLARVQELEQAREHRDDPPQAQERALRIVPSEVVGA